MKSIELEVFGLTYNSAQSGTYTLIMREAEGERRLPIVIGVYEAQAIAIGAEGMAVARPLTHDLFKSFATEFNIKIEKVIIYNVVDSIFFAKIVCSDQNKTVEIDARTSDAIAMAVRFNCPIYTYEFILSKAGMNKEDLDYNDLFFLSLGKEDSLSDFKNSSKDKNEEYYDKDYSLLSNQELDEELEDAINQEAYERAAKIRDEISKRNKKENSDNNSES